MPETINPHRRFYTLVEAVGARRELPGSVIWYGERRGRKPLCAHISRQGRKTWDENVKTTAYRVTEGEEPRDAQFAWSLIG